MSKKESTTEKVNSTIKNYTKEIASTAKALTDFTMAASLLIVSVYAIWASQNYEFTVEHVEKVLLFSGVLILIVGCEKFLKTIRR